MTSATLSNPLSTELPTIVLGSTSVFRQGLLNKLYIPFITDSPNIDETPLDTETVQEMVDRLSLKKAQVIAAKHPNSLIIASDQSAILNGKPLGKPHGYEKATQQLNDSSGQCIQFYTGLVVIDTRTHTTYQTQDVTTVCFRTLNEQMIHNYLTIEEPYQCAGSFKSEGLGITLFSKIETQDPNALIGLPLIELTTIFNKIGISLPVRQASV